MQSVYIQPIFRFVLQTLHNAGIDNTKNFDEDEEDELRLLSTEAILKWAQKREGLKSSHPRSRFIQDAKVKEFIEWLREEEDDEDDDDDDEDDDEDNDDED